MKKFLLMAVAAIAFMACGNEKNPAELPAKDKQMLESVSTKAVELIGKNAADVNKYMTEAGLAKANVAASAPKRMQAKADVKAAQVSYEVYLYGITAEDVNGEDISAAAQQKALKSGSIIMALVEYIDGKMAIVEAHTYFGITKDANKVYAEISDKYFAAIPEKALYTVWNGAIDKTEYTKHDEFGAAILAAEAVTASESANIVNSMDMTTGVYDGYVYVGAFNHPTEEAAKKQEEAGYTPFVTVVTGVADINAILQD